MLAASAGIYLLTYANGLSITGCDGTLPAFPQGWALLLNPLEQNDTLRGLPMHLFSGGSGGLMVWRDNAVTDAALERALELMTMQDKE